MKLCIALLTILGGVYGRITQKENDGQYFILKTETHQDCIKEPTTVLVSRRHVIQDVGRAVTLTCQASGNPEPRLKWIRNNKIISEEENYPRFKLMDKYKGNGIESLLTIISLQTIDNGIYTCKAVQESAAIPTCIHVNSVNVTLFVNHAPVFEDGDQTRFIYSGINKTVDLNCTADAFPTPSYIWFIETEDNVLVQVDRDTEAILKVFVNETTLGHTFRCHASNIYGSHDKLFQVLKSLKPQKPDLLQLYNSSDSEIAIIFFWDTEILFTIDKITVQYIKKADLPKFNPMPSENDWSNPLLVSNIVLVYDRDFPVTLVDLAENTEYWVRVQVSNEIGSSPYSESFLFSTITYFGELSPESIGGRDAISNTFLIAIVIVSICVVLVFFKCLK